MWNFMWQLYLVEFAVSAMSRELAAGREDNITPHGWALLNAYDENVIISYPGDDLGFMDDTYYNTDGYLLAMGEEVQF